MRRIKESCLLVPCFVYAISVRREKKGSMMKFVIITVCLLGLAVSVRADLRETYLNFMNDHMVLCANEMGLPQSELDELKKMPQLTNPQKEGCLAACVLKKVNIIDKGIISLDNVRSLVDSVSGDTPELADRIKAAAVECATKYSGNVPDECELGMNTLNCGITALNA